LVDIKFKKIYNKFGSLQFFPLFPKGDAMEKYTNKTVLRLFSECFLLLFFWLTAFVGAVCFFDDFLSDSQKNIIGTLFGLCLIAAIGWKLRFLSPLQETKESSIEKLYKCWKENFFQEERRRDEKNPR